MLHMMPVTCSNTKLASGDDCGVRSTYELSHVDSPLDHDSTWHCLNLPSQFLEKSALGPANYPPSLALPSTTLLLKAAPTLTAW